MQVALAGEMVVEAHRPRIQLCRDTPNRDRIEALGVGELDRRCDDPLGRQRPPSLGSSLGGLRLRHRLNFSPDRCYGVAVARHREGCCDRISKVAAVSGPRPQTLAAAAFAILLKVQAATADCQAAAARRQAPVAESRRTGGRIAPGAHAPSAQPKLAVGSKVRDCDITFHGPGPADWRRHSLSIGHARRIATEAG
ncbi:MAG: hypothetical protein WDZ46_06825 [Solirubrobacterales bacterium]